MLWSKQSFLLVKRRHSCILTLEDQISAVPTVDTSGISFLIDLKKSTEKHGLEVVTSTGTRLFSPCRTSILMISKVHNDLLTAYPCKSYGRSHGETPASKQNPWLPWRQFPPLDNRRGCVFTLITEQATTAGGLIYVIHLKWVQLKQLNNGRSCNVCVVHQLRISEYLYIICCHYIATTCSFSVSLCQLRFMESTLQASLNKIICHRVTLLIVIAHQLACQLDCVIS